MKEKNKKAKRVEKKHKNKSSIFKFYDLKIQQIKEKYLNNQFKRKRKKK